MMEIDQMNLPATSLRRYYRERVGARGEYTYVHSAVGSRPCELHSRWRTYALTGRDLLNNRKSDYAKYLTFEAVVVGSGRVKYAWKVDGHFRTLTRDLPVDVNGVPLDLEGRYKLVNVVGRTWKSNCVGTCFHFLLGNID